MNYLNLDAAPVSALSSVDAFTDAVANADALGFTDVIGAMAACRGRRRGERTVLEQVAAGRAADRPGGRCDPR